MTKSINYLMVLIGLLMLGACNSRLIDFSYKTPEEVAKNENHYFACFIDDELFRNHNGHNPFVGQLNMTFYPPCFFDTTIRNQYPYFEMIIYNYQDIEEEWTNKSLRFSTDDDSEFAINIDSIPFMYSFHEGMSEVFSISFIKSHPHDLGSPGSDIYRFSFPVELQFQIDSVAYPNGYPHEDYDVYGKLEAKVHNNLGDTIHIRNGLFKINSMPF